MSTQPRRMPIARRAKSIAYKKSEPIMHDKLFIPGPSEVRPELLQVVATPQIGHRTQKYKDLHAAVIPMLKKILYFGFELYTKTYLKATFKICF